MPDRDHYETLGVAHTATADEVKKAYRALARKHHPDVNPGDKGAEARFKEVQSAYDILGEAEKRKLYDQFGSAAFDGTGAAAAHRGGPQWASGTGAGPGSESFDFSQFFGNFPGPNSPGPAEDAEGGGIFEDILGRVRGQRATRRARSGQTTEVHLTIPFDTALRGGKTTIQVNRGTGAPETLDVKVPAGTDEGDRLRLRGRGQPGERGGPPGDLVINIDVDPHPYYTREGQDLSVEVPITVAEAILGSKVEVPTPGGSKTLSIPAGTSTGQRLRLRGQGVPATASRPEGDLYIVPKVVVPKNIDDEARDLIRRFAERDPTRPRDGLF